MADPDEDDFEFEGDIIEGTGTEVIEPPKQASKPAAAKQPPGGQKRESKPAPEPEPEPELEPDPQELVDDPGPAEVPPASDHDYF